MASSIDIGTTYWLFVTSSISTRLSLQAASFTMEQEGEAPRDQLPPRQPKSFLSLPAEIRIKIYDLVLFHPLGFTPMESLYRNPLILINPV